MEFKNSRNRTGIYHPIIPYIILDLAMLKRVK